MQPEASPKSWKGRRNHPNHPKLAAAAIPTDPRASQPAGGRGGRGGRGGKGSSPLQKQAYQPANPHSTRAGSGSERPNQPAQAGHTRPVTSVPNSAANLERCTTTACGWRQTGRVPKEVANSLGDAGVCVYCRGVCGDGYHKMMDCPAKNQDGFACKM
jgi:hypothetical protein